MSVLQHLRDYELRMRSVQPAPFMYTLQNVHWEIRLHPNGTVDTVVSLGSKGQHILAPCMVRTMDARAKLLMDNAEYVLGFSRKAGDKKTSSRHSVFVDLVLECASRTREPAVEAVAQFLLRLNANQFRAEHLQQFADFHPESNVMFTVAGVNPVHLPAVQRFWATHLAEQHKNGFVAECLLTGEVGPVMDREPVKIKGIHGGQVSGMNFISANALAFESYGLHASHIAPVKIEAAEQYANALNRLLSEPTTCLKLGNLTYVFWTDQGDVPPISEMLRTVPAALGQYTYRPEQVHGLLWSSINPQTFDPQATLRILGLSPSGSRIAIRSQTSSSIAEVFRHLAHYFAAQRLIPASASDRSHYDMRTLLGSMYRDISKEHIAAEVNALVQYALAGVALPASFLTRLVGRNRQDEYKVTRPRAVLIKMVLLSRDWKDVHMNKDSLYTLDPEQPESAYHLGRLLAIVDDIQTCVNKSHSTFVDRFYSVMSTTPYAVMGRLIQGIQPSLQRLRKEDQSTYLLKQQDLQDVMSRLHGVPNKPLNTPQQALFALGYYHQRAALHHPVLTEPEPLRLVS